MVRGGGGNTIATITFYGIWWFCHDPKRQQTRKQHNAQQERSNMDATTTCDYEYNYHHQCHMSAEMRFSQCLTIGFLLVVVSCHCHKTTIPAEMRFHGSAREYNELVQMLYKIFSNTRVTLTRERRRASLH